MTKQRTVRSSTRGMTLIELLSAMVIGSLLMTTIAYSFSLQHRFYSRKLDYTESLQNARVSLDVLRDYLRRAGFGFRSHPEATGVYGAGLCFDDEGADSLNCNNVDEGADRIRLYMGLEEGHVRTRSGDAAAVDSIPIAKMSVWTQDPYAARPTIGHSQVNLTSKVAMISGKCDQSTGNHESGTDVVKILSDGAGSLGHHHNFDFTQVNSGSKNFIGCPNGYTEFSFGRAQVVDFYLDKHIDDHPTLKMRITDLQTENSGANWDTGANVLTVAEDIETLQARYGIDRWGTRGTVSNWCDDPADISGACNTGLTVAQNLARIVAVEVAIVARTRQKRRSLQGYLLEVQDFTPVADPNGYNRFIFRATVAMRNNRL